MSPALDLAPGFADPVIDGQRAFRAVLEAMSHPGRILELPVAIAPPAPLAPAAAAICLALVDHDTPLWLDPAAATPAAAAFLRFHCGAPLVEEPGRAAFALAAGGAPDLARFAVGTDEAPERGATLVLQVAGLAGNGALRLSGPGIESATRLGVNGLDRDFWATWRRNGALFPRGVDVVLVAGRQIAGLPRTTIVEG